MPHKFGTPCNGCPYENAQHLTTAPVNRQASPLSMEDNKGDILLIFQSPGGDEWESGQPISSKNNKSAGGKLAAAFEAVGKTRSDFNITNTVQCFPGKKAVKDGKRPRDKTPPMAAQRQCAQWLRRDIEARDYIRIVAFGSPARDSLERLGYSNDERFKFVKHPTGGLSTRKLRDVLT